jgi:DNA-directed RNA polymerase subunit K/omega
MPPKKLILQKKKDVPETTIPTIIKVTKVDEKQISKPKISIIKTKQPIIEPIVKSTVEDIENVDDVEEDAEEDVVDVVDDAEEDVEDVEEDVEEDAEAVDDAEEDVDTFAIVDTKPTKFETEKEKDKVGKSSKQVKKDTEKEKEVKKEKDTTEHKIHNHSKPKTITASTKVVNTVDMFGDDDLDFRYVMMNYDYTKNVTMPKITKYERALLIGKRAKQIEEGANPNVKYISGQSVISIAEEELRQRKIPLIIKRPIGNKFEYWKPADMEVNMD